MANLVLRRECLSDLEASLLWEYGIYWLEDPNEYEYVVKWSYRLEPG